jgi:ubiquinone/menaquinone biosynthesis C-methylase UbiE
MRTENVAFIGSIPENYDQYLGPTLFEPYAADLVARVDVPDGGAVLELACGTGLVTRRLRDRLAASTKLVATDLNEPMMSHASRKFRTTRVLSGNKPTRRICRFQISRLTQSSVNSD